MRGSGLLQLMMLLLVSLFLASEAHGAAIELYGSHSWKISGRNCTFATTGGIRNSSTSGISGSVRLCLWVTANGFPSYGYRVATYQFSEQLLPGYQYSGYSVRTTASVPKITGFYQFTVSVEEFTTTGWITRDYIETGRQYLRSGRSSKPPIWKPPGAKVQSPLATLAVGSTITITLMGGETYGNIILVPAGSRLKLDVKIESGGRTTVYGGSKPAGAPALYSYSTGTGSHRDNPVGVGRLYLDYGYFYDVNSNSDLTLFFQNRTGSRGYYKSIDQDVAGGGTSWGLFTVKNR